MSQIIQTHMFWAYGRFSNVEKISAKSFLKNGYQLNIWTYGDISNAPSGATLKDAREILPESLFFSLPNGSCAPFSDFFRYAVLNKVGGLWVDTDVIAVKSLTEILQQPFLVTERHPAARIKKLIKETFLGKVSSQIVNNVIFNPIPSAGNIIDLAYHYSERFPKQKVRWGELGPNLLYAIEKIYPDHGFRIMPPEFANPFGYWTCPNVLLKPGVQLHEDAAFVHLYNETWRNAKVDKNAPFPRRSLMSFFAEKYL
jgi:glycosyl transferase-like sugar-binding protein